MPADSVVVALRLVGGRMFTSGLAAAATGMQAFESKAEGASVAGDRFNKSGGKMKGVLGALGPMVATGATALGAAGTAAALFGLKFNASMEQSRVAFTNLLGSGERAEAMLDRLYEVSKATPFEFPQLTQAAQKLLGFGMASKDIVPTMTTIGDAVAGVGGGAEQIDAMTRALGQMQAKGKVSSEELLQLAEAGVPALKILQDELGLTGMELDKKLRAGALSADKGIGALMAGMRKRYGGMAKAQSKTFSGMLSSMKDSAMQILGQITMPLFTALRDDVLPAVNDLMSSGQLQKWASAGMDAIGSAFEAVVPYVEQLIDALKPLAPFIENILWPLLKGFAIGVLGGIVASLKILIPIIKIVATVLGWLGEKARPLRGFFQGLGTVLGFFFGPTVLGRIAGALMKAGGAFKWLGGAIKVVLLPVRLLGSLIKIGARAFVALGRVVLRFAKALVGYAGKAITAYIGAWRALGGKLVSVLRAAFDKALNLARTVISKFVDFGKKIVTAIVDGIKSGGSAVLDAIKGLLPGGLAAKVGSALKFWQHGGVVPTRQWGVVGERGPELLELPGGSKITPLRPGGTPTLAGASAALGRGTIEVPVYLNGREIALAVADDTANRRARR